MSPTSSPTPTRRLLIAALLLMLALGYPAARVLPESAGWENSTLENLQVALLLLGAVLAWRFARASRDPQARTLGWSVIPVWLALAARELSWGAVFGQPVRMSSWGPVYSSSTLWYKPAVVPVLAVGLAVVLVAMVRGRVFGMLWKLARTTPFIWLELVLVVLAALLSTYAEGHLPGFPLPAWLAQYALVMEEWMEVVLCAGLLATQQQIFTLLRKQ